MQDDMAQFDRGIFNNATLIFKKTNVISKDSRDSGKEYLV